MTNRTVPQLYAVTRPLEHVPELAELMSYVDPAQPLVWTRGDRGCVATGELMRLEFTGPERFAQASREWQALAAAAHVDDPVRMPGSGLLAFGAFAFDDSSAASSVLIIPNTIVARHRGTAWITRISTEPITESVLLPPSTKVGDWPGATFTSLAPAEASTTISPTDAYLSGVAQANSLIAGGSAEKIVLARQEHATIDATADLRVPLGRLAERYLDCWTFAVDGMIGASPETLVRQTDGAISARVLAGTRGRKNDQLADLRARDELLTSSKEQHEHAFAVQSVITALSPHVQSLHTSEAPFALQLPNVWHLATDLGATPLARSSALDLVAAMHPTAAVAGTPTASAVAAIAELEPFDRGRYAGPVGWLNAAGDGEWVIALRCAQVSENSQTPQEAEAPQAAQHSAANKPQKRTVTASAGGGIVAGSDPEREFGETVSKLRPITEAFAR